MAWRVLKSLSLALWNKDTQSNISVTTTLLTPQNSRVFLLSTAKSEDHLWAHCFEDLCNRCGNAGMIASEAFESSTASIHLTLPQGFENARPPLFSSPVLLRRRLPIVVLHLYLYHHPNKFTAQLLVLQGHSATKQLLSSSIAFWICVESKFTLMCQCA